MKMLKRALVAFALSLVVVLSLNNVSFAADEYAEYITDEEDLYPIIREAFVNREATVTIKFANEGLLDDGYFNRWIEGAVRETGEPDEGDYIRKHLGRVKASGSISINPGGIYCYDLELQAEYYTTKAQEDVVEAKIDDVFEELAIDSMKSDYEKVVAIYDYICENVVYDYDNLNNESYKLQYTAYAALINKTSVCQGYSNLLYRMLHEADIDSRIITGFGNDGRHAWNIIELGGKYYYADATWDAVWGDKYFLKGTEDFVEHTTDDEFLTETFLARYPIAATGYVNCTEHKFGEYVADGNATCMGNGTKTATCTVCGFTNTIVDDETIADHIFEACAGLDPTCKEPGYVEYACVVCWNESVTYREEVAATGNHTYGEWVVEEEATCLEDGLKHKECTECGEVAVEVLPATGHKFENYVSDNNATCAKDGTKTAKCESCNELNTIDDVGSATGIHEYGAWIVDKEATYTEAGFMHAVCSCGKTIEQKVEAAWGEPLYVNDAEVLTLDQWDALYSRLALLSCWGNKDFNEKENVSAEAAVWFLRFNNDLEQFTNANYAFEIEFKDLIELIDTHFMNYDVEEIRNWMNEYIALSEDFSYDSQNDVYCFYMDYGYAYSFKFECVEEYNNGYVLKCNVYEFGEFVRNSHFAINKTADGYKIAAQGDSVHAWNSDYTVDKAATCKEEGSKSIHCAYCDVSKDTKVIEAAHAWNSEFTVDKEATCEEEGVKSIHCANCDETKDVTVIQKSAHAYGDWYTVEDSTTTVKGTDRRDCTVCDAYETRDKALCTWKKDSKGWYFLDGDGNRVCSQWVKDSSGYCYLDANGYMVYNKWCLDSTGWAYAGSNGYRVTNKWIKDSAGWCYVDETGYMVYNQWVKDSQGYCYVNETGYMVYNTWVTDENGQSYVGSNGYRTTNKWIKDGSDWCYLGADGYKVTNKWVKDSIGWCWLDESGCMVYNQWVADS